jgi:hypothetical protein
MGGADGKRGDRIVNLISWGTKLANFKYHVKPWKREGAEGEVSNR